MPSVTAKTASVIATSTICPRPVRVAGDIAQPTHGLADVAVAGLLAVRPGLSVAGDAHQHDARIYLAHAVVAQIPGFEPARAEVLDDDVALGAERKHQLLAARLAQVQRDEALIAGLAE